MIKSTPQYIMHVIKCHTVRMTCTQASMRVSACIYNSHEFKPKITISYQKNMYVFWRISRAAAAHFKSWILPFVKRATPFPSLLDFPHADCVEYASLRCVACHADVRRLVTRSSSWSGTKLAQKKSLRWTRKKYHFRLLVNLSSFHYDTQWLDLPFCLLLGIHLS